MPTMFHHHPDGYVRLVVADAAIYEASLSDFAQDCAATALPAYGGVGEPWRERQYLPGIRHTLSDGLTVMGDAAPWPPGDAYLSAAPALVAARLAASAPLP